VPLARPRVSWSAGRSGVPATAALLSGIYAAAEARTLLERRYLDGHRALFPDAIADWARLLESAERLASLGALSPLVASRRGGPRSAKVELPGLDLDALGARARTEVPVLATSLIEETRAATLDVLGDTEGTASLAARRLRTGPEAQA